jgi:hypothetical protein
MNDKTLENMRSGFFRDLRIGRSAVDFCALGLTASVLWMGVLEAADRPGYLPSRGANLGRIRTLPPPKPQIPALPPLPQTYVPEPKHTAEFITQLHATSAQFGSNFTVRAESPDPVYLGNTLAATANPVLGPYAPLDATAQTEAILGYFSAGRQTNGVPLVPGVNGLNGVNGVNGVNPVLPIVLPINGLLQPQPAVSGSSRATYELK